ncbi:hypothetical protein [Litorimonas haliclonae]|uniref:hypothetical protein n=1 Tax=Litorimonas haliclonae TaxID=2081977 RepID=UPI0039EE2C40
MPHIPDRLVTYPIGAAQILANKVAHDMTVFVKRHVFTALTDNPGLNWRDIFVLSQILRYPGGLTPAEISGNTRLDPATVLRANEKLRKVRFIIILEQAFDARSNLIQVTPEGAEFLQELFQTYLSKQATVLENLLPRLGKQEIRDIFETCLDIQEHAEQLSALSPSGKVRRQNRTAYSRAALQDSFDDFQRFPEFVLQVYCRRISNDYMSFLKTHAMSKMSDKQLRKPRELLTLMTLEHMTHDATAMDVAKLMRYDPATTSRAVSILSEAGYTKPLSGYAADDRKKPLIISEKGMQAVQEYSALMINAQTMANERISGERSQAEIVKQLGVLYFIGNRTEGFASIRPGKLA